MPSDEIQKIPLRHEGEELAVGRELGEISYGYGVTVDDGAKLARFLMRQLQKLFEQSELVD